MWLSDSFSSRSLFPDTYSDFQARRDLSDSDVSRGVGALVAVHHFVSCKRRYDLELIAECVRIEIAAPDGFNLLTGNHYFSLNTDVKITENYFNSLESLLNTNESRIILVGDFNFPGSDWINGYSLDNSHFFFLWGLQPNRGPWASSFLRFLDHTQRRTTVGRTPLDE